MKAYISAQQRAAAHLGCPQEEQRVSAGGADGAEDDAND